MFESRDKTSGRRFW